MACIAKNNPQEKKKEGEEEKETGGRQSSSSVAVLLRAPLRRGLPGLDSRRTERSPALSPSRRCVGIRDWLAPFQTAQDYFTQVRFCCCLLLLLISVRVL